MGDVRFDRAFERLTAARDVTAVLKEMTDEELVAALAGATSRSRGAYLVNVVATEILNRMRRREADLVEIRTTMERQRAELETRVAERTRDLARANQDLESFTYMASHDLRAPLRGVEALADFTVRDYADRLDAEGKERLRSLHASARRMSQLIEDLLHLSRSGREALTATDVDVTALARGVGADIAKDWRGKLVAFHVADGLVARADPRLLRIAIENVLRNAWKFSAKAAEPRVEVSRGREGEIEVRDNGVGFEPREAHRLFHAFERLHPTSQFEGTGIGLAIVRRIVERHGGRVWAEGAPGKGASFHLLVPTP